jgi:hypothetical protein
MKLICECGKELNKSTTFHFENMELEEWITCLKCGKKYYLNICASHDQNEY